MQTMQIQNQNNTHKAMHLKQACTISQRHVHVHKMLKTYIGSACTMHILSTKTQTNPYHNIQFHNNALNTIQNRSLIQTYIKA